MLSRFKSKAAQNEANEQTSIFKNLDPKQNYNTKEEGLKLDYKYILHYQNKLKLSQKRYYNSKTGTIGIFH